MKRIFLVILFATAIFSGCKKEEDEPAAPELPASESFLMSFNDFDTVNKKALKADTSNWAVSAFQVGFWNLAVYITSAIPVSAFQNSFKYLPVYKGDNTWEWAYTYNGFLTVYGARLVAKVSESTTYWEMYISRVNPNPFAEVLWYSGTTNNDRSGASWELNKYNESTKVIEKFLRITHSKTSDNNQTLRYTNIIPAHADNGNYIEYALQIGDFNSRFSIQTSNSIDADIEWNSTTKEGRVRSLQYFGHSNWRCWDSGLNNSVCN